jgi:hypothetical protein
MPKKYTSDSFVKTGGADANVLLDGGGVIGWFFGGRKKQDVKNAFTLI